uniref:Fibronectin type-III domain-containing protein n=1 Tax=Anas zonorhyncha TaxID=75864 RepID=A0A8B9V1P6_9AVES
SGDQEIARQRVISLQSFDRGRCCAGVAQIKCLGSVWIEPGLEVLMGSNISINCLSTVGCPRSNLSIQLNSTARNETLRPLNSSAAQLRLHDFRLPYSSVLCFDHCGSKENKVLVCGTEVWAGYPPETPGNLTCTIGEDSGSLACTWDAGRPTHLRTEYRLHLNSTQTAEENVFPAGSPVPLSALRGGSCYLAWVQARNALGTALSAPQHLDLQELGTWGQARVAPLSQPSRRSQALPVPVLGRWIFLT